MLTMTRAEHNCKTTFVGGVNIFHVAQPAPRKKSKTPPSRTKEARAEEYRRVTQRAKARSEMREKLTKSEYPASYGRLARALLEIVADKGQATVKDMVNTSGSTKANILVTAKRLVTRGHLYVKKIPKPGKNGCMMNLYLFPIELGH